MTLETSEQPLALPVGTEVRGFLIQEVLGSGGFGIVYKARHRHLQTVVALKEYLPPEVATRHQGTVVPLGATSRGDFDDGLRRFLDEAMQLAAFDHIPSIVSCRDYFQANGTAYLVMEYEDGLPLSQVLADREESGSPFDQGDLLAVMIPLLKGLAQVHAQDVLHRDITPANILIRTASPERVGGPVLIDFGAAKQNFSQHSKSLAPYTAGYAAIEQVAEGGDLGAWTDLYAIGAIMWRIVAGGAPGRVPLAPAKVESRMNAVLRGGEDPIVSATVIGKRRFSESVLRAIDDCLKLRESDRLQSCEELLPVLEAASDETNQSSELVTDPPTGFFSRIPRWVTMFAGIFVAVVAAAYFTTVWLESRAPEPRTISPRFTVLTDPVNSTVDFLNVRERYVPGMALESGQYHVEVSMPGYKTRRAWVEHTESAPLKLIELESEETVEAPVRRPPPPTRPPPTRPPPVRASRPEPSQPKPAPRPAPKPEMRTPRFTVLTDPAKASVTLLNVRATYSPGMPLQAGSYHLEVSAPRHKTTRVWVEHSESSSVPSVALEPLPAQEVQTAPSPAAEPPKRAAQPRPTPPPKARTPPPAAVPAQPTPVRVGGNIAQGKLVRRVRPKYPDFARRAGIEGVVKFEADISERGTVKSLSVISGPPALIPSARAAVMEWRYRPTLLNGKPVEVTRTIEVNFKIDADPPNRGAQPRPTPPAAGPAGPTPVQVGGNIAQGKLVRRVRPKYPDIARRAGIEGVVKFEADISENGSVMSLRVVSGPPALIPSARTAVMEWRYRPTLLNGTPVEVTRTIEVNFKID